MRLRNHSMLKHSSRNLPLKLSLSPFCHGLPGSIKAVSIFASASQPRIAWLTNSGPLSERRNVGAPRSLIRRVSTSMTRVGADAASDVDGEAFAGELVDHGEAIELLTVGAGIVRRNRRPTPDSAPSPATGADVKSLPVAADVDAAIAGPRCARADVRDADPSSVPLVAERCARVDSRSADTSRRSAAWRRVPARRARHAPSGTSTSNEASSINSQAWRWVCPRSIAKATWSRRACELTIFGG